MADELEHEKHYCAFISYSRSDSRFVRDLHRRLENYRLPHRLAGRYHSNRSRRLRPIFRDVEESPAAHDLTAAVRQSLAASQFLIVVCSPTSAKSAWVEREIELFRDINGDENILAALIEGGPENSFPPALLRRGPAGEILQPLAADFRTDVEGRRNALLKLVAALTGIGFDELVQRDAQRRIRRVAALSMAGLAGTLVFMGLSFVALQEREAAEHERERGGTLISYLLTDLRARLKTVGRLDVLDAANKGMLAYYKGQDLSHLSGTELQQRAKLLLAIGEDKEERGDLAGARVQIEEAGRSTAALLEASPNDTAAIFTHAQSEFFMGMINWRMGNRARAAQGFNSYRSLAQRLLLADRSNSDWWMEVGWANNNLGMLKLRGSIDVASAESFFKSALHAFEEASRLRPKSDAIEGEIAEDYAWLGDVQRLRGNYAGALEARTKQREGLERLLVGDPKNAQLLLSLNANQLAVARIDAARGALDAAIEELNAGREAALLLARADPENMVLAAQVRIFELFQVRTWLAMPAAARPSASTIERANGNCGRDLSILKNEELATFCTILWTRRSAGAGDRAAIDSLRVLRGKQALIGKDRLSEHWGLNFIEELGLDPT
jgi:tetratricopeptide (TPR) repeat protein